MHSSLHRSRGLVLVLALLIGSVTTVHARLISVDMQSGSGTPAQNFSGVDPEAAAISPLFGVANVWNHLQRNPPRVTNPTFTNLVDSTGASTTVSFAIVGTIDAFNAYAQTPGADALRGDAFFFNDPFTSPSIDWTLTGLTPNTNHLLFFYGGFWNHNRSFNMFVDTDGDGDLSDETAQAVVTLNNAQPPGTLFSAISDASGAIRGRGVGIGYIVEADWAGFQVAEDLPPDPCTDALPTFGCTVNGVPNQLCQRGTSDDLIIGASGNDVIRGGPGADTLKGNAGDDLLCGDAGDDILNSGAGNDVLDGEADTDDLTGGPGIDTCLNGGKGNDLIDAGDGDDIIKGGDGDDVLLGGSGADILDGNQGKDALDGGKDEDILDGGPGKDVLVRGETKVN